MKKKTNLKLLFGTMGIFKLTLAASVVFAAVSAVTNIYAYSYIYRAAQEVIAHLADISAADTRLIRECGKNIMFCICAAFGFHGFALLFSHNRVQYRGKAENTADTAHRHSARRFFRCKYKRRS